ncbi:MAG: BON domain-containing protein [Pirellulales bacterium]|nr:BON domain-containing protein [Pirellulales bacterium]
MARTSDVQGASPSHLPHCTVAASTNIVEVRLRMALAESHYSALRSITCRVVCGEATLEGDLESYYQKQVAQAIAARVPGVVRVHNRIQVKLAQPDRWYAGQQGG